MSKREKLLISIIAGVLTFIIVFLSEYYLFSNGRFKSEILMDRIPGWHGRFDKPVLVAILASVLILSSTILVFLLYRLITSALVILFGNLKRRQSSE